MTSWLTSWFSASSPARPSIAATAPTVEETAETIQSTIDGLSHKRLMCLRNIHKIEKEAKKFHLEGKVDQAKSCLRRKAAYTTQVRQLETQIANLEQTLMAVESTATGIDVANSMKGGAGAMQSLLQQTSVDEVHEAADDLQEAVSDASEIMDAVSAPIHLGTPVDDDALDAELASWASSSSRNDGGGKELELPSVPAVVKTQKVRSEPSKN